MAFFNTVIPPQWWEETSASPAERVLHLALMALADRDGIAQLDSCDLAPLVGASRLEIVQLVRQLAARAVLTTYQAPSGTWAWLPSVSEHQPTRGHLQRPRDQGRPAPPKEAVLALLGALWGREATTKEGRRACPRAWGRTGAPAGGAVTDQDVATVWEAWRDRQERPGACQLGAGAGRVIRSALREARPDQLVALVAYAYEADEAGPRFWRGENSHSRTYLGLDNLLVLAKLQARLQLVAPWSESDTAEEDGTDLGPLAAYRRQGPRGTRSTPDPRPARLSDQCRKILALLVERGEDGVRTNELAAIALKYTGRLSEIRGAGHDVVLSERCNSGNNLYKLMGAQNGVD